MPLTLNPTITFTGEEAREGILERAFAIPALAALHTIHGNMVADEQIGFLGRMSKITLKDTGCGTGKSTKTLPMYEKKWSPVEAKIWLQPCWKDFVASFFVYGMKKGINRDDLTSTDLAAYIIETMTVAVKDDALRNAWFSDKLITDKTDSPAGTLGSSDDIVYYNMIDGLWKQIFAVASTTVKPSHATGAIPRYTIAKNAGVNYAGQVITADSSLTIFRELLANADKRLRHAQNKVILVTDSIFADWQDYREGKNLESTWKNMDIDIETGTYRGCTIVPMEFWDRHIASDFDNGTTLYLPHRAVLTTVDQMAIGFDDPAAVGQFDMFLDKSTELYNIKGAYRFDAKILENYMFSVAY